MTGWAVWDVSASQTELRVRREQNTAEHTEYAQDRARQACLNRDPSAYLECVTVEVIAANDHGRAESDLDAQQAMAFWAKLMTLVSAAGVVFTGLGIYLVWGTLFETRQANKSAQAAVDVTREIGQAQTRAYVRIVSGTVSMQRSASDMCDTRIRPDIKFVVTNYGPTPAYEFQRTLSVRFSPPLNGKFKGDHIFSSATWGKDIGPKESIGIATHLGPGTLTDEEETTFQSEEFHVDVHVKFRFRDVFDNVIEDERMFTTFIPAGLIGIECKLQPHVFDRETIDRIAEANSPERMAMFADVKQDGR